MTDLRQRLLRDRARARAGFGEATAEDRAILVANPPPRPAPRPLPIFRPIYDDDDPDRIDYDTE